MADRCKIRQLAHIGSRLDYLQLQKDSTEEAKLLKIVVQFPDDVILFQGFVILPKEQRCQ